MDRRVDGFSQSPLEDIRSSLNINVTEIGDPNYDDPSLALLFSQLEAKTLQAVKGTAEQGKDGTAVGLYLVLGGA